MKRTMKKMVSMALTGTMAVAVLAGAGTSEVKSVVKVNKGGRQRRFSACVVVGDRKGQVANCSCAFYVG